MKLTQKIAKITKTHLGLEDHGILSWNIDFRLGTNTHQGTGHRFLDNKYGPAMIKAVLKAVGVDTWESLVGKTVYVLYNEPRGMIQGIEMLPTESRGGIVVFDDVIAAIDAEESK